MKKRSASRSTSRTAQKKADDVRLLAIVLFIGVAIVLTVVAAFQVSRLVSNAYRLPSPIACGMRCNPTLNNCPSSAPYCVRANSENADTAVHRCSRDPNVARCGSTTTPSAVSPTRRPTGSLFPSVNPTRIIRATCSPSIDGMPCYR